LGLWRLARGRAKRDPWWVTALRSRLLVPLLLALVPAPALADTCAEVHQTCLESCHVDFGMEAKRVQLAKCVQGCDRDLDGCGELGQEQKRSSFKLDQGDESRRSEPGEVGDQTVREGADVRAAPYEDFDEQRSRAEDRPKPRKADVEEQEGEPPAKVERARREEPEAEGSPPQRESEQRRKKKEPDLSDDNWAR